MYGYGKLDHLAAQYEHKTLADNCCKGTKKFVDVEGLTFDDCKTCLFQGKTIKRGQVLKTRNT